MEGENNVSVVPNTVRKEENVQVEVEAGLDKNTTRINESSGVGAGLDKNTTRINESNGVGESCGCHAVGNSGGILCVWEKSSFKKINSTVLDYFVITKWNGEVIVMGNFNEVRYKNKRYGSVFHAHGADAFNSFISNANLQEIPLGGCAFTWCHRSASKMSKFDRFLMSEGLLSANLNFSAITWDRYLSDHRPIMLHESFYDYGPIPFRSFHYWFEIDGFEEMISKA
nr:RNA-directed DNA polymerase, eukaryota [Tanacetum cinerariifolium]